MKKLTIVLACMLASVLSFAQATLLDWNAMPASFTRSLVTNVTTLKEDGIAAFDFQGAVFGEYAPKQTLLLFAKAIQIDKTEDGQFCYTCVSYNSRDFQSIFVVVTPSRVKGLNLNKSALFLCRYVETRELKNTNKDTGVAHQMKVPFFTSAEWWYGITFDDDTSLYASADSK